MLRLCALLTTRSRKDDKLSGTRTREPRANRQAGYAAGELLVLTVPLCVACMALASKLTATASARTEGQWRTSLKAQQATTEPCGLGDTDLVMTAPIGVVLADSKIRKAWEPIAVSLLPTPSELPQVAKKKIEEPTAIRRYYYQRTADSIVPDGITQVTTSATFVCNEPQHGDSRRKFYEVGLIALGVWQAATLFGTIGSGGGGASDPAANLPSAPDYCQKGSTEGESPCDVLPKEFP